MNNLSDICATVSELPPQEWAEEVLRPLRNQPVSIFGYQQIAMDRSQTMSLVDALVSTGCLESKGSARRMVQSNAVMVNRVKTKDVNRILTADDALPNIDAIVIEAGKYNFGIVELCG